MLNISNLKTSRFNISVQEIAMLNAIKLANMQEHLHEKQNTFLLNSIIESAEGVDNPLFWTIQERMFAVGHYIASTQDGSPDFEIGDANYSDYLQGEKQYSHDRCDLGEYDEDHWYALPLLGIMAETIEALEGEIEGVTGKSHWYLGCMAAQLVPNDMQLDISAPNYDQLLLDRMVVLSHMGESDFLHLMSLWSFANKEMMHLFNFAISDSGIVAVAKEGGADMPYARFLASSAITTAAKRLCGKSELSGT